MRLDSSHYIVVWREHQHGASEYNTTQHYTTQHYTTLHSTTQKEIQRREYIESDAHSYVNLKVHLVNGKHIPWKDKKSDISMANIFKCKC